jgi:hypothetical protein
MFNKNKPFSHSFIFSWIKENVSSLVHPTPPAVVYLWWSISMIHSENKVCVKKVFLFFIEQIVIFASDALSPKFKKIILWSEAEY